MARNAERANAMLNKWITIKQNIIRGNLPRKAKFAEDCDNLKDAEFW